MKKKKINNEQLKGILLLAISIIMLWMLLPQLRLVLFSSWTSFYDVAVYVLYVLGVIAQLIASMNLLKCRKLDFQFNYVVNVLVGFNFVILYMFLYYPLFGFYGISLMILTGFYYKYEFWNNK